MSTEAPDRTAIAVRCAKMFRVQMAAAGVTVDVQLAAIEMLAKAIFVSDVKLEKRLELLDKWSTSIRNYVVTESKPKKQPRKSNGKS